jgi:hypothetical protein
MNRREPPSITRLLAQRCEQGYCFVDGNDPP